MPSRTIGSIAMLVALVMIVPTRADNEGFIDNWEGKVNVELRALDPSGTPTTTQLPVVDVFEPLSTQVTRVWNDFQKDGKVCNQTRAGFVARGKVAKWLFCHVSPIGELRGRISKPNVLDLKYIVRGNRVRFEAVTPSGIPGFLDPTMQVDFEIELRLRLEFDPKVNGHVLPAEFEDKPVPPRRDPKGAPYLVTPARLTRPTVSFVRSKVTAEGILSAFIGDETLRDAEREVNAITEEPSVPDLGLADINRRLHKGTKELAGLIQLIHPELGTPAPVFDLSVMINADRNLVIQYKRFGNPPLPLPGCRCDSRCNDQVNCICAGAGLVTDDERFFLQRQRPDGTWRQAGDGDTFSVTGNAFGARTGETVTYRMCRINEFGSRCTEPVSFVYKHLGVCPRPTGPGIPQPPSKPCAPNCPE